MANQKTTGAIAQKIVKQISEAKGLPYSDNSVAWLQALAASGSDNLNTFFKELMNVVISQRIKSEGFDNPLAKYKTGQLALGVAEAELYVNPQTGRNFYTKVDDMATGVTGWTDETTDHNFNTRLMLDRVPDIREVLHPVNFARQQQRTYSDYELSNVSVSWEKVGEMIDAISRDLNASMEIEEYTAMRGVVAGGIGTKIPIQPVTDVTDKASAEALLVKARSFFTRFQFPSEQFSGWNAAHPTAKIKTWCKPDSISIIMTSDLAAVVDVTVLAAAFHMDKADFIGKVMVVDSLDEAGKVKAVLFDDTMLYFVPKFETSGAFYNPATCKQNFFLTRTEIMDVSPFSNAVAFTTDSFTDLTEQPDDWATAYTNYFYKTGTTYTQIPEGDAAPTFAAGKFAALSV